MKWFLENEFGVKRYVIPANEQILCVLAMENLKEAVSDTVGDISQHALHRYAGFLYKLSALIASTGDV